MPKGAVPVVLSALLVAALAPVPPSALGLAGEPRIPQLDSTQPIARLPTATEKRAIRRAAMRDCRPQEFRHYRCKWLGHVKVSTINPRYAWAEVSGPNYDNSGVLRRGKRHPGRWKMIRVVGGGIQSCGYWRSVVPPRVVTDLGIEGFTQGDEDFTYHPC